MDLLHICHVLLNYCTCFQSTIWMSGTVYVKILHIFICTVTVSNITSYSVDNNDDQQWTRNNTKYLHTGEKNPMVTLVYQIENTVDYHYLERI